MTTDKVDAATLARLRAAGFLPEFWVADADTYSRRRQIAKRGGILAQVVRIKGFMRAILRANLIPPYKGHLFGKAGQCWLDALPLPPEERGMLQRLIAELERVSQQLAEIDKIVSQQALDDPQALRLMTIPGVSSIVASTVLASGAPSAFDAGRAASGRRRRGWSSPSSATGPIPSRASAPARVSCASTAGSTPTGPEAASARAVALGALTYKSIASILANGLDRATPPAEAVPVMLHPNLHGSRYFY
ncbi:hypothetical protein [Methylobacterium sp. 190mf]|uniref:hypothetical protein n=1 Tax=Methylobacterium sp. 190mf TaxID=1761798 RepID=UPI001FCEB5A0|nr:hypothetical protein [Methylobacterium sp. 190mf]